MTDVEQNEEHNDHIEDEEIALSATVFWDSANMLLWPLFWGLIGIYCTRIEALSGLSAQTIGIIRIEVLCIPILWVFARSAWFRKYSIFFAIIWIIAIGYFAEISSGVLGLYYRDTVHKLVLPNEKWDGSHEHWYFIPKR